MQLLIIFSLLFSFLGHASPFEYDIHFTSIPGSSARTMVCFHGYGSSYKIAHRVQELVDANLISFNFPDHDILSREDKHGASYGTIQEVLPALYVLKQCVIDEERSAIDLYGHSAGGGAIINLLSVLNTTAHDSKLLEIGITQKEKALLLSAIQNGLIILDTPLKSVEEIIDYRGSSLELELLAKQYRDHSFRPIDSIDSLEGLSLDIILHFQEPDEILFNRDDQIFAEKLQKANRNGTTSVIIGNDGGHTAPHNSLWQHYSKKLHQVSAEK